MLSCQKHLFQLREDDHYLNCAYKAPLLRSVEEAALEALIRNRNPVDIKPGDYFEDPQEVRALFAEIIHAKADNIALIPSTSYGLSSVLQNVSYEQGQHAVTVENEFPSDYFALTAWCKRHQAELKVIRPNDSALPAENWNHRILEAITEETAVVVISSIHWMNGLKFNLEAIGKRCREKGAKFIVDGTQSVGALPMDVKQFKIDALICAGYKWLMGPYSLGLAYIGDSFNDGTPIEESWMNRTNARNFSELTQYDSIYKPGAGRYNVGESSNFILIPMLKAALQQLKEWDPAEIQHYAARLSAPLFQYLQSLGIPLEKPEYRAQHLFGLKLPASIHQEDLKKELAAHKVYLSQRGETLRVALHLFNTEEDVDCLLGVIQKLNP